MLYPATEVRVTLFAVLATLVITSLLVVAVDRLRPQRDCTDLLNRIRGWWLIIGFFSIALIWSPGAMICFMGLVSFLALKEFLSMTPTRRADRRVLFYAYLAVPFQYGFAAAEWYKWFILFIPVIMFLWLPTRMWMIGQTEGFLRAAGTVQWALMLTVFSLSHAAYLLVFETGSSPRFTPDYPSATAADHPGSALLLFLVVITGANDIFQYVWDRLLGHRLLGHRLLGHRQFAPTVSPNKTYAGLVGGFVSTVILSLLLGPSLTLLDAPRSLLAGILISLAGFAGDLCFSALKRDLGIKDFSATLPGHGGVLDRVDSLVFTAPLFFHFVYYGYGP